MCFTQMFSTVYYVSPSGNNTNDGISWATATASLNAAQKLAVSGDQIWIAQGTYTVDTAMTMISGVDVYGGFVGTETELSARSTDATLTILQGNGAAQAASKNTVSVTTRIEGITFLNIQGNSSGGVFRLQGPAIVSNCRFVGNSSTSNGGALYLHLGTLAEKCYFEGNSANVGGGAIAADGNPQIISCEVVNNTAGSSGGGIFATDNKPVSIVNCLVANNESGNNGGGIYLGKASSDANRGAIINCTIVRNKAASNGGGVCTTNSGTTLSAFVYNTILWGNADIQEGNDNINNAIYGVTTEHFVNNALDYAIPAGGVNNIQVQVENDVLGACVRFLNPTSTIGNVGVYAADWSFSSESAAINAGDNTKCTESTDIQGNARVIESVIDLGAYESTYGAVPSINYYVSEENGNDANLGSSWDAALASIDAALNLAIAGDKVWVEQGDYSITSTMTMKSGVNVYGGFPQFTSEMSLEDRDTNAALTILTAVGNNRILYSNALSDTTVWDGFTFTGANYSSSGAAMMLRANSVLYNCILTGNVGTGNGGAAYLYGGTILENCTISNNQAKNGGGVAAQNDAKLINCIIINNTATGNGGGVFVGNYPAEVINCLVANNSAAAKGGGVCFGSGSAMLTSSTVVNNEAGTLGGGLQSVGTTVSNSILWGNVAGASPVVSAISDATANVTYTALDESFAGVGNILLSTDNTGGDMGVNYVSFEMPSASVGVLAGVYAAQWILPEIVNGVSSSAAINAGNNALCDQDYDLVGNNRVIDGVIDLGAYEAIESTSTTSIQNRITTQSTSIRYVSSHIIEVMGAASQVSVYSFQGAMLKKYSITSGPLYIELPQGAYIIKADAETHKVIL